MKKDSESTDSHMVTLRAHWPPTKTQTKPQLVNYTQAGSANQTHTKKASNFFFFLLLFC